MVVHLEREFGVQAESRVLRIIEGDTVRVSFTAQTHAEFVILHEISHLARNTSTIDREHIANEFALGTLGLLK